jgi:hypothetical protein
MNYLTKKLTGDTLAGFALLYAVIVIAVVSSLGSVLSNLLVREADLSATSRESSRAYYSADAAQECALYWDLQRDHFDNPRDDSSPNNPADISCSGVGGISITSTEESSNTYTYEFSFENNSYNICVENVTITKRDDGDRLVTEVSSVGSDSCGSPNVQRALRTTY